MSEIAALSLRIQETGGQAVVDKLKAIDKEGGDAGKSLDKVTVAMKGVTASASGIATAVTEVRKWTGTQQELSKEIAEGTRLFALQARTVDATSKTAVQELRSSAAAQREWLKEIGASEAEQLKFSAAVQTFERKVTAAENAQKRAASQTDKQAAATKALGGTLVQADGQLTAFGKGGLRALNGLAFAFSQMASQGETSLRSLAGNLTSVLSLLGKGGAVGSIVATIGLSIFDIFKANQKRAIESMALQSATASRAELTRQKAALELTDAQQQTAYQRGLTTLGSYYDQRAKLIADRTATEIKNREQQITALEREAAQRIAFVQVAGKNLPDALRGDTLKQAEQLRAQATQLRAEIDALAKQGAADAIRNTADRAAAERQLEEQILAFESRRLAAQGKGHHANLAAIELETRAYEKLLVQQGLNEEHRALASKQYHDALVQRAQLEQQLTQIATAQQNLDTRKAQIQADVALGKTDELSAAKQIAQAEQDALPALQQMADKALAIALALGDQGAVAAVRALKQELSGLGRNSAVEGFIKLRTSSTAGPALKAAVDRILADVAAGAVIDVTFNLDAQNLTKAAQEVDQQFQQVLPGIAGVLSDTLGAAFSGGLSSAGDVLLRGLGGIMQQMGSALISYGLAMSGLLPALTNPFTSGPAAIAAGVALVALGGLLGGIATGKKTSTGSSATSNPASAAVGDTTLKFFVTDPRVTGASHAVAGTARMAPLAQTLVFPLMNPADPASQRLVSETVSRANRRGA